MDDVTDEEILELWNERAAIREYDGERDRKWAEQRAVVDVRNMLGSVPDWLVKMVWDKPAKICNNSKS